MAENDSRPQATNKYSLYTSRNVKDQQIDWANVAQTLTVGLEAIRDEREAKKAQITADTQAALSELSKIQDTDDPSLAKLLIDGSNSSKEILQANMNLLRRGLLDPKDYALIMQSQKDGYANINNIAKNYDANYKEAMARLALGEDGQQIASDLEIYWNGTAFSFGNLQNKRLISNAATGDLELVELVDDGTGKYVVPSPIDNPENFVNPNTLLTLTNFRQDRQDTLALTKRVTDTFGEIINETVSSYTGPGRAAQLKQIKSFKDLFSQTGIGGTFDEFIDAKVLEITGDSLTSDNAAQVLMGLGYEFAQSLQEFQKKHPGLSTDKFIKTNVVNGLPQVELTADQLAIAKDSVKKTIISQLDNTVTQKLTALGYPPQTSATSATINKQDQVDFGYIKDLNTILTDPNTNQASNKLRNLIDIRNQALPAGDPKRILKFTMDAGEIRIYFADGNSFPISRKTNIQDNPATTVDESRQTTLQEIALISSNLLPGNTNLSELRIEQLVNANNFTLGALRDEGFADKVSLTPIQTVSRTYQGNQNKTIEALLTGKLGTDGFRGNNNVKIANQMESIFTNYIPPEVKTQLARDNLKIEVNRRGTQYPDGTPIVDNAVVITITDQNGNVVKNSAGEDMFFAYEYFPQKNVGTRRADLNDTDVLIADIENVLNKIIGKANESRAAKNFSSLTPLSTFVTDVKNDPNFSNKTEKEQNLEAIRRWNAQ